MDGYTLVKGALERPRLAAVLAQLDSCLSSPEQLVAPKHDAARLRAPVPSSVRQLSNEQLRRGQARFRHDTNYVNVRDPLLNCPAAVDVVFDDTLLDLATAYFGCPPLVGHVTLRRTFVNELDPFDVLRFHRDVQRAPFVKVLLYLNDVSERDGPLRYVPGSHRGQLPPAGRWRRRLSRRIQADIEEAAGGALTGDVGDLIVFAANGLHRGSKPLDHDRSALLVSYVVDPKATFKNGPPRLSASAFTSLAPRARAAAALLSVV